MKLPNAGRAVVDERKISQYLLSRSHPIGRFKAAVFAAAGFQVEDSHEFSRQLQSIALSGEAELGRKGEFGQKYLIPGVLTGKAGASLEVVTVWIVGAKNDAPQLVTVYPR